MNSYLKNMILEEIDIFLKIFFPFIEDLKKKPYEYYYKDNNSYSKNDIISLISKSSLEFNQYRENPIYLYKNSSKKYDNHANKDFKENLDSRIEIFSKFSLEIADRAKDLKEKIIIRRIKCRRMN